MNVSFRDELEISECIFRSDPERDRYQCLHYESFRCSQRVAECISACASFTAKTDILGWPEKKILIVKSDPIPQLLARKLVDYGLLTESEWRALGTVVSFPEQLSWLGCPPWIWGKVFAIGSVGVGGIRNSFLCLESEARYLLKRYLNDSFTNNTDCLKSKIREQKKHNKCIGSLSQDGEPFSFGGFLGEYG